MHIADLFPRTVRFVLLALGGLLLLITVPGVFSVDEVNYAVTVTGLMRGTLFVPGTEGFPPSRELCGFDPEPHRRNVTSTPVFSLVAPLYAFIATPFALAGWRGLALVNSLAYLAIAALVFGAIRSRLLSNTPHDTAVLPWLAFATFVLGGFSLEYAVAVWPHMLAAGLCTGSVVAAMRSRQSDSERAIVISGFCAGVAMGVREQNIAVAAGVGAGLLLYNREPRRAVALFVAGLALPVAASFVVNGLRLGAWTPFPKLAVYAYHISGAAGDPPVSEVSRLLAFVAKTVNFAWFPGTDDPVKAGMLNRDTVSGAYITMGIVKKALLQSAPWIGAVIRFAVMAWTRTRRWSHDDKREIRALSLVILPVLAVFFFAGSRSIDGWAFNQRYFLEIVPVSVLILAVGARGMGLSWNGLGMGIIAGVLIALLVMGSILPVPRHMATMWFPLLLAFICGGLAVAPTPRFAGIFTLVLGCSLGWALFVHVGDDLLHSSQRRRVNAERARILTANVPDHSVLFVYWGAKDATGPLLLAKDVVLLDAWADDGHDAPRLAGAALSMGRRVVVLAESFPQPILDALSDGRIVRTIPADGLTLFEVRSSVPSSDPLTSTISTSVRSESQF